MTEPDVAPKGKVFSLRMEDVNENPEELVAMRGEGRYFGCATVVVLLMTTIIRNVHNQLSALSVERRATSGTTALTKARCEIPTVVYVIVEHIRLIDVQRYGGAISPSRQKIRLECLRYGAITVVQKDILEMSVFSSDHLVPQI
ncbi:hypothetical protein LJB42_004215 [Komagataella kurtzmanii]|nr:hypothetical protein LJB42_004215 [Komagataella kurtzmanii]